METYVIVVLLLSAHHNVIACFENCERHFDATQLKMQQKYTQYLCTVRPSGLGFIRCMWLFMEIYFNKTQSVTSDWLARELFPGVATPLT